MTVYWICPRPETPSGGAWFIHRLARMLNDLGHKSYVFQAEIGNVWWDANPIEPQHIKTGAIVAGQGDTVIIPEYLWPQAPRVHVDGARRILFVQNYIWLSQEAFRNDPAETLVCSRFLANHMQRVFKTNVTGKLTPFLDEGVWGPTPKKKDRTLLMARRNPYHAAMKQALEAAGFPVEYVTEPLSQKQLAAKLADCEFYIHLTHPEGFPMACLEAMRMGTIVVGTTGGGGNEFMFNRETAMVVQDPDNGRYGSAEEFVNRIMEQMQALRADDALRSRLWNQAHNWSLRYKAEATMEELKAVFGNAAA